MRLLPISENYETAFDQYKNYFRKLLNTISANTNAATGRKTDRLTFAEIEIGKAIAVSASEIVGQVKVGRDTSEDTGEEELEEAKGRIEKMQQKKRKGP